MCMQAWVNRVSSPSPPVHLCVYPLYFYSPIRFTSSQDVQINIHSRFRTNMSGPSTTSGSDAPSSSSCLAFLLRYSIPVSKVLQNSRPPNCVADQMPALVHPFVYVWGVPDHFQSLLNRAVCLAVGLLDDLFAFDPSDKSWTDLSNASRGTLPSARYAHGFTSSDGKLYVHGGFCDPGRFTIFC
jgi:hypothetical protein